MAIVESVVEILLQKLGRQLIQEAIFLYGVSDQVELLVAEFRGMQSFLKDADTKQEGDERVKNWVRDVRNVAYDAEDVIDTFVFKIATLTRRCCISRYAFIFNELIARHKVGSEIERIKNEIRRISESRSTYGIENIGEGSGTSSVGLTLQEQSLTSPNVHEPDFVGFEKDLDALVARLVNEKEPRRCVVSVVGMGGLGKTTLTRKVYNTDSVKKHFQIHAWISVSQEFSVKDRLQVFVKSCMDLPKEELESVEKMDVVQLSVKISNYLNHKRYLLVLDDIWKAEAWDAIKGAFPDTNNGSRVLLTTRNKDVALHADVLSPPYELQILNKTERWELFCKKTFPGQDGSCPQRFQKVGNDIVEECGGLPLAIVLVGGFLSGKEKREWDRFHKGIRWQITEGEVKISSIFSLSYKDMPYYLKSCFLYLGNFPEDYVFVAKDLIRMWVAEGLVEPRGRETLEEVGEDYLKELVQRSMVQVAEGSSRSGGIKSFRIHDLLRDLSISKAEECFFLRVHSANDVNAASASEARHLAIHHNDSSKYISLSSSSQRLRSVLIYTQGNAWLQMKEEKFLFRGFKLLRVLYLHGAQIKELPKEIGKLIHLRYLGCAKTKLKSLPSSIGNLSNLQTLFVTSSFNIEVPSTIKKMQQLRHLQVQDFNCWGEIEGNPRLEGMSNLQTLSLVKAGKWIEGCLGNLTNLRKLGIGVDEDVTYVEVLFQWIPKLDRLDTLKVVRPALRFEPRTQQFYLRQPLAGNTRLVLPESNEFPERLTKLSLEGIFLEQDPLPTLERLKSLQVLKLHGNSYVGKVMTCSAEGFPRLESLLFHGLFKLETWRVAEGAMPSLLHLHIKDCRRLKKLPEGLQHVTTLKKLSMSLISDVLKKRLEKERGEDWHEIRRIPSIDIR